MSCGLLLQVESVTNHDVKAIEYVIKERIGHNAELAKVHSAAMLDSPMGPSRV